MTSQTVLEDSERRTFTSKSFGGMQPLREWLGLAVRMQTWRDCTFGQTI